MASVSPLDKPKEGGIEVNVLPARELGMEADPISIIGAMRPRTTTLP